MASADGPGPGVADPLVGQSFGNYRVVKLLGAGGMGAVYLAEQPRIGKRVAVKVLHPAYAHDRDVLTRFFREAQLVNQIRHENLIDVLDFGDTGGPDGSPYIIMELLEGDPLSRRLARGPLAEDQARHIGAQVARALEAAHGAGVVHRDLKPENVFLVQRGQDASFVKLLDFGIAKLARGSAQGGAFTGRALTAVGSMIGTPLYMSPEQIRGREVGPATDLYALGCLLHEMVTGVPPFAPPGATLEVLLEHHLKAEPPPPGRKARGLSAAYDALTLQCLEKDPARRPRRAAEVAEVLGAPPGALPGAPGARPLAAGGAGVALAPTAALEAVAAPGAAMAMAPTAAAPAAPAASPEPAPGARPPTRRSQLAGEAEAPTLEARRSPWRRPLVLVAGGTALLATGILVGVFLLRVPAVSGPPRPVVTAPPPISAPPTRASLAVPVRPAVPPRAGAPAAPARAAATPSVLPAPSPPRPTARAAARGPALPTYPSVAGSWVLTATACPFKFGRRVTIEQGQLGKLTVRPRLGPPFEGHLRQDGGLFLGNPLMTCQGESSGGELSVRCWLGAESRTCTASYRRLR